MNCGNRKNYETRSESKKAEQLVKPFKELVNSVSLASATCVLPPCRSYWEKWEERKTIIRFLGANFEFVKETATCRQTGKFLFSSSFPLLSISRLFPNGEKNNRYMLVKTNKWEAMALQSLSKY